MILGLPFLATNKIVIDHDKRSCVEKETNYDLLSPAAYTVPKRKKE